MAVFKPRWLMFEWLKPLFIIIFLAIFCLCPTSCIDYECTQGDCKNGFGTAVYDNGDKYVGEFKNGKRHGQGTITSLDSHKYAGEWKNNKMNGKGFFTYSSGRTFIGLWKNGKRHGKGILYDKKGKVILDQEL